MRIRPFFIAATILLAGCATTNPGGDRLAQRDPLEGFNRAMWGLNDGIDKVVLKPTSTVYRTVTPKPLRRGLTRVLSNLSEPWSFINNVLQGKPKRAFTNLGRFIVNTTVGVAGLADPAAKWGMEPAPEDFGQTLASWGVNAGPYLVLPVLGPSTLRDGVGAGVAQLGDPYRVCLRECGILSSTGRWIVTGSEIVIARSGLIDAGADAFLKTSVDPYATARSAYLQRRRAAILDQDAGATSDQDALDAALADIDSAESGESPPTADAPGEPQAPRSPAAAAPAAGTEAPTAPAPDPSAAPSAPPSVEPPSMNPPPPTTGDQTSSAAPVDALTPIVMPYVTMPPFDALSIRTAATPAA